MPDIEELIQQAMLAGKFGDLPGKGKPLHLDDNPHANPEWRLAYHLLQSNGFLLPWIEQRHDIEQEFAAACANLQRSWAWRNSVEAKKFPADQVESEWRQALEGFSTQMQRLNQRIRDYNLQAPAADFQMPSIHLQREIERLTAAPPSDRL